MVTQREEERQCPADMSGQRTSMTTTIRQRQPQMFQESCFSTAWCTYNNQMLIKSYDIVPDTMRSCLQF